MNGINTGINVLREFSRYSLGNLFSDKYTRATDGKPRKTTSCRQSPIICKIDVMFSKGKRDRLQPND